MDNEKKTEAPDSDALPITRGEMRQFLKFVQKELAEVRERQDRVSESLQLLDARGFVLFRLVEETAATLHPGGLDGFRSRGKELTEQYEAELLERAKQSVKTPNG